jgi:hypothetical protein
MSEQAFRFWQIGLLALNALLLWRYVVSTRQIEKAAIQQAKTSARQADISAQQAKFAADQLEGASRPVLVMRNATSLNLELANVGNGPRSTYSGGFGLKIVMALGLSKRQVGA